MTAMKPRMKYRLVHPADGPVVRGRYLFSAVLVCLRVSADGGALGPPGYSLVGYYVWPRTKLYRPNGAKECERRRRQIGSGYLKPSRYYCDSIDYGNGGWDHKEFVE